MIIVSVIGVLVIPDRAIHTRDFFDGLWRGIFSHKNYAGGIAAIGLIIAINLIIGGINKLFNLLMAVIFFVFLWNSDSKTAASAFPFAIIFVLLSHPRFSTRIIAIPVIYSAVFFASTFSFWIINFIGDDGFTGRIAIWKTNILYSMKSPFIGHGYRAVYYVGEGKGIADFASGFVADNGHAHNGYMEIFSQLGIIGLFICVSMLLSLFVACRDALLLVADRERPWFSAMYSVACFELVRCMFEPDMMSGTRLHWLMFLYCLLAPSFYLFMRSRLNNTLASD
jgi:O-antigen ligase